MKGYRTDENGRWSPSYRCDSEDGVPLVIVAIMAVILFAVVFLKWWFA